MLRRKYCLLVIFLENLKNFTRLFQIFHSLSEIHVTDGEEQVT